MKILVVDDEPLARRRIVDYLRQFHENDEIEEAEDGFQALEKLQTFAADLIFLDVEMPEMTGFDFLLQLESRPFQVIFQTAYNEFAVRAFDANAIDYLLKPFSDERIAQAMAKVRDRVNTNSKSQQAQTNLEPLDKYLTDHDIYLSRLLIRVGQRIKIVDISEVQYFVSESHVTRVFLQVNGNAIDYALDQSLSTLEKRLDPKLFVRTHRNSLVNLEAIHQIKQGPNMSITLKNGIELPVSRERKKQLLKQLGLIQPKMRG